MENSFFGLNNKRIQISPSKNQIIIFEIIIQLLISLAERYSVALAN